MSETKIIEREYPRYIAKNAISCPFCGSDSVSVNHSEIKYLGQNGFGIKKRKMRAYCVCNKCYARGKPVIYIGYEIGPYSHNENYLPIYSCGDEAIEAWNTRKPIENALERLEEMRPEEECCESEDEYTYMEMRHNKYIKIIKELIKQGENHGKYK